MKAIDLLESLGPLERMTVDRLAMLELCRLVYREATLGRCSGELVRQFNRTLQVRGIVDPIGAAAEGWEAWIDVDSRWWPAAR